MGQLASLLCCTAASERSMQNVCVSLQVTPKLPFVGKSMGDRQILAQH